MVSPQLIINPGCTTILFKYMCDNFGMIQILLSTNALGQRIGYEGLHFNNINLVRFVILHRSQIVMKPLFRIS